MAGVPAITAVAIMADTTADTTVATVADTATVVDTVTAVDMATVVDMVTAVATATVTATTNRQGVWERARMDAPFLLCNLSVYGSFIAAATLERFSRTAIFFMPVDRPVARAVWAA